MGVYAIMKPDEVIDKALGDCEEVAIVGCSACANDSLGITSGCALCRIIPEEDRDGGEPNAVEKERPRGIRQDPREDPVAIAKEVERLKQRFVERGVRVRAANRFGLCGLSMLAYDTEREAAELRDVCKGVDAVVSVACLGGTRAVKLLIPAEVRVVSAMKTVGVFQICKELDETAGLVYANQQRSRVWRFVRECSDEEAQMDRRPS